MDSNTAQYHINQHPDNYVDETGYTSQSNKAWAQRYKPISNRISRSYIQDGYTHADFEPAFLPLYADDHLRLRERCLAPNYRQWRFEVEADCESWFHAEVSNVVLSAWASYPAILQSSHNKPPREERIGENVDILYSFKKEGVKYPLAIGEVKRNLINPSNWQSSDSLRSSQDKLSRELRG